MKYCRNHPYNYVFIFIWMIFYWAPSSTAQVRDSIQTIIQAPISKEERIEKIESLLNQFEISKKDSLNYLYQDYAYWLYDIGKKKEAIVYENKALDFSLKNRATDIDFIQRSQYYLGFYYFRNDEILESIDRFKEVITINNTNSLALKAYQRLGLAYLYIHDYYQAANYFELVISVLEKDNSRLDLLRNAYQNLVNIYLKIETLVSLKKGQYYARKADSLASLIPTSKTIQYRIKVSNARLYNQNETLDTESSLTYYTEASNIAKAMKDTNRIRDTYMGIGNLLNASDIEKSTEFHHKSLEITKKKDTLMLYQIYTNLGFNFQLKNNFEKAIEHDFIGLEYLTGIDFKRHSKITTEFLIDFPNKKDLLISLPQLAETYLKYYETNKEEQSLLDKSISYFKLADRVIDLLKLNSHEFSSRLFWRELSTDIYGKAIKACYLNNNTEDAYYFMEKNKALLLLEDLSHQKYKQSLKLPASYLKKEDSLQTLIYKKELLLKHPENLSKSEKARIKKERIDLTIELSQLRDSETIAFTNFDNEPTIISLSETQADMPPNEVLAQYHISIDDGYGVYSNNDNGYVLFVTKNNSYFYEIENLKTLKEQLGFLITSFKGPFKENSAINSYAELSNKIYLQLFPSEEIRALIENKKLTIAPDNYLSLLPFEALSTSEENIDYLIHDAEISYLYSYSFLKSTEIKRPKNLSYLGIAPGIFKNERLSSLHNSFKEVENLDSYYSGTSFTKENASKSEFLKQLGSHDIIHLATHANAQDSISPWIAFYDESINLEELYLTQNKASLVVLSGCNTTLGRQETGEGIMSLARGFFYGGAQSVVSSLWSIDDQSTTAIVADFYKNLSEGKSKSEALHLAKIEYLETHSLSEVSPHYWASLILLGSDDTLNPSGSNNLLYIAIGILILFAIFFGRRHFSAYRK